MPQTQKPVTVHGDDLLYRFFQDLMTEDPEAFAALPMLVLQATSVWLPPEVCLRTPVMIPFAVRDPSCRGSKAKGIPDQWASPRADGYLRDDNSLVKGLTRRLRIKSLGSKKLNGAVMGREFVASHVWRKTHHALPANQVPVLNTFVPNLVWLPTQVSKLTDREGSPFQQTLQAMSAHVYRHLVVPDHLRPMWDEAWAMLPIPTIDATAFQIRNYFVVDEAWHRLRHRRIECVVNAIEAIEAGKPYNVKDIASRYQAGLGDVSRQALGDMKAFLTSVSGGQSE